MQALQSIIENGLVPNVECLCEILRYYVRSGKMEEARQFQDKFHKSFPQLPRTIYPHNLIMSSYLHNDDRKGVIDELFRATKEYKVVANLDTYKIVIRSFRNYDLVGARKMFDIALHTFEKCLDSEIFVLIMEEYHNRGDMKSVQELYDIMISRKIEPDIAIYQMVSQPAK